MDEIKAKLKEVFERKSINSWGATMEIENLLNQAYFQGKIDAAKETKSV